MQRQLFFTIGEFSSILQYNKELLSESVSLAESGKEFLHIY